MGKTKKRNNKSKIVLYFLIALLLFGVFFSIYIYGFLSPSNNREWDFGFQRLPQIHISKNTVSIKNIRDYRYDSGKLTSSKYINRTVNLNDLQKVWLVVEPFPAKPFTMLPSSAHTYFVFDFKNQEPLVLSVEARREKGEDFNILSGFFNSFELIYIWGTEKDITGRRVLVERNKVYMYPLAIPKEASQKLFLELAKTSKDLEKNPRFYNTIMSNCTNELIKVANKVKEGSVPFNIMAIIPGLVPEQLYALGFIKNDKPFAEVEKTFFISNLVKKYYSSKHFSQDLRTSLP